jgi:hypothetical protein
VIPAFPRSRLGCAVLGVDAPGRSRAVALLAVCDPSGYRQHRRFPQGRGRVWFGAGRHGPQFERPVRADLVEVQRVDVGGVPDWSLPAGRAARRSLARYRAETLRAVRASALISRYICRTPTSPREQDMHA